MRIALLGDIGLFGRNTVADGSYQKRMARAKESLEGFDYVIGNLETPLTNATRVVGGKSAYIKGAPEDVEILRWLGVTHVSLANNHMFDYRERGLVETIDVLESSGIGWYGANGCSTVLEGADGTVALHGYCCYSTNGKGLECGDTCVNVLDPRKMESDLDSDAATGRYPILSCHWGQEHVHYPNYDHVKLSRRILSNREALIHGHHPHVIQGMEKVGEALVAYSLGNFCFDDVYTDKSKEPLIRLSQDNKETFVLEIEIDGSSLVEHSILPLSFVDDCYSVDERIGQRLNAWSDLLEVPEDEYNVTRAKELSDYLLSRKKLRDFEWYLKRMNIESVRMIAGSRRNAKRYSSLFSSFI